MMNKFHGSGCGDYIAVADVIHEMLESMRTNSTLQKAEDAILKHYAKSNRLMVTRLSDEDLPIEHCYINLAIVERNQNGIAVQDASRAGSHSSPFFLSSRRNLGTTNESSLVQLTELFNQREGRDPRRILIRGRAGVGKTTLCKKMVYEFTNNELWRDKFDRILWIPLRNLKLAERKNCSNVKEVLFHEFFKLSNFNAKGLAAAIIQVLDQGRTLFLLDGWDEVDRLANEKSDLGRLLQDMRGLSNVIITSRPSVLFATKEAFDLELETVGFNQAQVDQYIEKVHKVNVSEIKRFLQGHEIIRSLVRIPIQLDAVCYCWNDFRYNQKPETMTGLYTRIQTSLWKKDIPRLGKKHSDGQQVQQSDLDSEGQASIELSIQAELEFIECLAFFGLIEDVIEFEEIHFNRVVERLINNHESRPSLSLALTLPNLSILRSSDPNHIRSYHFIHLTFQEYYAARYFLRNWNKKPALPTFREEWLNEISAAQFLQEQKYNPRYDIMWRFVAGLFSAKGLGHELLTEVEQEPLDLLGPSHQRLVMHCLREMPALEKQTMNTRRRLEQDLSQWVLFETQFRAYSTLAEEPDFPDNALKMALDIADTRSKAAIRKSIQRRQLPLEIIKMACNVAEDDDYLGKDALDFLTTQDTLPDEIIDVLTGHLSQLDDNAFTISKILLNQSDLSNTRIRLVFEYLSGREAGRYDEYWVSRSPPSIGVRREIPMLWVFELFPTVSRAFTDLFVDWLLNRLKTDTETFKDPKELPQPIEEAIVERLAESISPELKISAIKFLGKRKDLSEACISSIIKQFDESDIDVRMAALKCLSRQLKLQAPAINAIIKQLGNTNFLAREDLYQILRSFSPLPGTIAEAVMDRIDDTCELVKALGKQSYQSERCIDAIARTIADSDSGKRQVFLEALPRTPLAPERVIAVAAETLMDSDPSSQKTALDFLRGQKISSEKGIGAIAELLNNPEPSGRRAALEAFTHTPNLPRGLLVTVAKQLKDIEPSVRKAALIVLGWQNVLSGDLVADISAAVKDPDRNVQLAAMYALRHEQNLPAAIIKDITGLLGADFWHLRRRALARLGNQEALDDQTIQLVLERLEDPNIHVRREAVIALGKQTPLKKPNLDAIKQRLEVDDTVKGQAEDVLQHHGLPPVVLTSVIRQLENTKESLRGAVLKAIGDESPLRKETVDIVKLRLEVADSDILQLALQSLKGQISLPQNVIKAIVREISHGSPSIKTAAIESLARCTNIPEASVEELSGLLAESEPPMQGAILQILLEQKLSQNVVDTISKLLKCFDRSSRYSAWRILVVEVNLSLTALGAIVDQLSNHDSDSKWQSLAILKRQESFSEAALRAFATQATIETGNIGPQSPISATSPATEVLQLLSEILFHAAFEKNMTYYVKDNYIWVIDSWGQRKIDVSLDKPTLEAVVRRFKDSRPTDYPVSAV